MNILICVKQVPDTTEIKIDPVTNTLIRAGVPSIVNPFDAYALEIAARIKDKAPGSRIVVVSMGPPQAEAALKECLSVGGDVAYLVSDKAFGGSDTLATSYILSRAFSFLEEKEGKFDVIFCGKQAIDGDTAQVGPEMAEHLDLPQITYAIDAEMKDDKILVKKQVETGILVYEMQTPCLITVTKTSFEPRFPSIKSKLAASRATIGRITADDLDIDLSMAGLKGSPTKVKKTFTPVMRKEGQLFRNEDFHTSVDSLFQILTETRIV